MNILVAKFGVDGKTGASPWHIVAKHTRCAGAETFRATGHVCIVYIGDKPTALKRASSAAGLFVRIVLPGRDLSVSDQWTFLACRFRRFHADLLRVLFRDLRSAPRDILVRHDDMHLENWAARRRPKI